MKNVSKFVVSSLSLFLFAACSDDPVKDVAQTIDEPGLMKTWEGPCGIKIFDVSARQVIKFSGGELQEGFVLYEDDECKTASAQLRYEGDLTVLKEPAEGVRKINTIAEKAFLKALTPAGVELLDKADACGIETWEANKEVDITTADRGVVNRCPFRKLPESSFNTFALERVGDKDVLFLGEAGLFENGGATEESRRPTEVDRTQEFNVSNWNF